MAKTSVKNNNTAANLGFEAKLWQAAMLWATTWTRPSTSTSSWG